MKLFGRTLISAVLTMVGLQATAGCRDNTPPPPNVPVPSADDPSARRERDPIKPLPRQETAVERTTQPQ